MQPYSTAASLVRLFSSNSRLELGYNHTRVRPPRSARPLPAAGQTGRRIRKSALRRLCVHNIAHPFASKCSDIGIVRAGTPEKLRIAHPTKTLVALRAVRGDTDKVTALPPDG